MIADPFPIQDRLAGFLREAAGALWFTSLGAEPDEAERGEIALYLDGLRLSGGVEPIADWAEARRLSQSPDLGWWNAEEAERKRLLEDANAQLGQIRTASLLSEIANATADSAHGRAAVAAARGGVADAALIRVAAGAATQSAYLAALAQAAGRAETHPFAAKFRLFQAGHWPLGVIDGAFRIF